ncbi:hypothetical protein ORM66_20670 [Bacillus cereus]|uniref:hypothetical protein n=1 Tax=Bacillus cereus TaxID=1396 RepID=UPI000BF70024|nr:hypothetical protein [Bacillus cereus]MDZ4614860.1 hypothetical protein [Bacillus cereus]PFK70659.1 hypothetical protein COJ13_16220 [Bacillus cereus]
MIRHITTLKNYGKIKDKEYLLPRGDGNSVAPEKDYIAFESHSESKAFYKAILSGKEGKHPDAKIEDLVGLIFDEEQLKLQGFEVINSISKEEKTRIEIAEKKFTTKWENVTMRDCGVISGDEFSSIGEYVFVKGKIPIEFLVKIETFKK